MKNLQVIEAFARHHRIGFQFSGGRDSTAALYYLRPLWPRMEVYHLDTGDQFPETQAVVRDVEKDVAITRIEGHSKAVRAQHGLPSDLVPVDNIEVGRWVSGRSVQIISRYDCCARSIMMPMHQRMKDDGVSLIVRGQRDSEFSIAPTRSGTTGEGMELLFPIEDWTDAKVMAYIKENHLPLADFYATGATQGSDCMTCTAWWDDGRFPVLRRHPQAYAEFKANVAIIKSEIDRQYSMLEGA